jgi:hypothetical protein
MQEGTMEDRECIESDHWMRSAFCIRPRPPLYGGCIHDIGGVRCGVGSPGMHHRGATLTLPMRPYAGR